MKNLLKVSLLVTLLASMFYCTNDHIDDPTPVTYSSVQAFFEANRAPSQTFTFDASVGGTFTTPQGTIVSIPANAFLTTYGAEVAGNVTVLFKDVYKKSDMVFNQLSTNMYMGGPIKSAGMFYLKASQATQPLVIKRGNKITIKQPLNGLPIDTGMRALVAVNILSDTNNFATSNSASGWTTPPVDTSGGNPPRGFPPINSSAFLNFDASNYVFSLYQMSSPVSSGAWYNSDNPNFFSRYTQTKLTLVPQATYQNYPISMFLVFSDVNAMVSVNRYSTNFYYQYAPLGQRCTAVAVSAKDGKLFASFTPITIGIDMTVNFSLAETTADEFKAKLNGLN
jgi:hypothetical protein